MMQERLEQWTLWAALALLVVWAMVGTIELADEFRAWRMGYCSFAELRDPQRAVACDELGMQK